LPARRASEISRSALAVAERASLTRSEEAIARETRGREGEENSIGAFKVASKGERERERRESLGKREASQAEREALRAIARASERLQARDRERAIYALGERKGRGLAREGEELSARDDLAREIARGRVRSERGGASEKHGRSVEATSALVK
jgi:hypothetical protein